MTTRLLYFTLALGLLLGVSRCNGCNEPGVTAVACPLDVPELTYATDFCDQPSVVLSDWTCAMGLPPGDWPEGNAFGDRSRLVRLAPPTTGEVVLNFYSAGGGDVVYQVLARKGGTTEVLQASKKQSDLFWQSRVAVAAGYDSLYLRLEVVPDQRGATSVTAIENSGGYVEITAADRVLELPRNNSPEDIAAANQGDTPCLGNYTGRLVVSTCDRNVDLANWAAELGLEIREVRTNADGSSIGVVILPNAAGDPTKATAAIKQKKADVNDDGVIVEPDILFTISQTEIFISAPGQQQNDLDQVIQERTSCMPYAPNRPPSVAGTDGVRVAIIDSGLDAAGSFGGPFANHAYRDSTLGNLASGSLGFDYNHATSTLTDSLFHGTSVAGIVLSQYKGSAPLTLLHQKIFDARGVATYFGALVAIQEAIDAEVDLINTSWGIAVAEEPRALRCVLERAATAGIVVVASAGNASRNLDEHPQYPAAFAGSPGLENVISVAAYEPWNYAPESSRAEAANFTNYSSTLVTLAAFQAALTPARQGGDAFLGYPSGTSFSAPLVTATLATYLSNGIADPVDRLLSPTVTLRAEELNSVAVAGRFLPVCHDASVEVP